MLTSKKRISAILLSVFTMFNLVGINAANAFEYGGFGLRPADLDNETVRKGDSSFSYEIQPGSTKRDGLMVINNTKTKKTFLVYVADSIPSTDGGFACRQFSEEKKEVGSWIKLEKNEIEINPGSNEVVPFTITMPSKIDAGEHNGCFLIQEKKEDVKDADKKNGIQLSIRTGLRVSIIVPGDLVKQLSIGNFDLSKKKKGNEEINVFNVSAINTGNVSVKTDVKLKVYNSFGIVNKTLGGEFIVLRGDTSVWNFELPRPFWGGFYKAKLSLEYNKSSDSKSKDKKDIIKLQSDKTISFFSFPTKQGLISEIAILCFMVFCGYLFYIWKQRQNWIKTWKEYKVARSTNIKVLAEKYDVSWKLLARVNNIKAPYMINAKDAIRVPSDTEDEYSEKKAKPITTTAKKRTTTKK